MPRADVIDLTAEHGGLDHDALATGWDWRWGGWASWRLSGPLLALAAVAVVLDVVTAWTRTPEWFVGPALVSPALPLAGVLVVWMGFGSLGAARDGARAWREFLLAGGLAVAATALAYAHTESWRDVAGVVMTAAGEEIVYRVASVVVLGALFARLAGRDWRSPAQWGSGPGILALVASALVFSALPGHVQQMTGATSVVPFASLAIVLGYAVLRTGSVLPAIVAHVLLDLTALAYLGGHIGTDARVVMGAATLVGLASGAMLAGRRLGLRRRVPAVIDLRAGDEVGTVRRSVRAG
jgi:hypothetical protein